jgi:hypothetical protein
MNRGDVILMISDPVKNILVSGLFLRHPSWHFHTREE